MWRTTSPIWHASGMEVLPAILMPVPLTANHTEIAYYTIKRQIIELRLPPGGQFTEGVLAREAGVSKSPVRDALGRLQRDGLVASIPRSGYYVCPVTLGTTRDLGEFRVVIEPAAGRLAAKNGLSDEALSRLTELADTTLAQSWTAMDGGIETYLRANLEFDALIANSCGNRQLTRAVISVLDDLERVLRLILPALTWSKIRVEQRKRIVAALSQGDGDAAYELIAERTGASATEVFQTLLQSPAVLDAAITSPSSRS